MECLCWAFTLQPVFCVVLELHSLTLWSPHTAGQWLGQGWVMLSVGPKVNQGMILKRLLFFLIRQDNLWVYPELKAVTPGLLWFLFKPFLVWTHKESQGCWAITPVPGPCWGMSCEADTKGELWSSHHTSHCLCVLVPLAVPRVPNQTQGSFSGYLSGHPHLPHSGQVRLEAFMFFDL